MNHKEGFLSHNDIFYNLIMLIWPWISLERESYRRRILRTRSGQCHNNPVLVPPSKPPDPMKDLYDGQIYDLKTRVDILTRMDVVPVEYGTLSQKFHLNCGSFSLLLGLPSGGIM